MANRNARMNGGMRFRAACSFVLGMLLILPISVMMQSPAQSAPDDETDYLRGSITRKEWYETSDRDGRAHKPKHWLVRKADKLVREYKLGMAEYYYRQVLKKDPKNAGAHNGLGKVYYERTTSSSQSVRKNINNLHNRAIQEFYTAIRYEPNYAEAHLNLGVIYLEHGRLDDAKEYFANALALDPDYSDAHEMVGRVLLQEGQVNNAVPFLLKAIELDSGNSSAHYLLGKAYTYRGEYDAAYEQLNIAMYQFPNSAPTHYQMGLVHEKQGNGAAAVNQFKKAISIKPEYADASLRLAQHYQKRGDQILALEQLKNTLEGIPHYTDPGYYPLTQKIAALHLSNQQTAEAELYYQKILRYWPSDKTAQKAMSEVKLLKAQQEQLLASGYGGDFLTQSKAQAGLDEALEFNPGNVKAKMIQVKLHGGNRSMSQLSPVAMATAMNNPALLANQSIARGEVWTARYDYERAHQEFQTAMRSVDKPDDIVMVGEMLLDMGQPDLAIRAFNRVTDASAAGAAARKGIESAQDTKVQSRSKVREALLYRKSDYSSEKRRILDEAIELNHRNAEAHLLLGEFYSSYKNYRWAIRHYHVYLSLNPPPKQAKKIRKRIRKLTKKMNA